MNEKMRRLGEERSAIRELYEYGLRMKELGEENVFDFSLGSPSVPTSESVQREIGRLLKETPPEVLHGYTSAAGLYSAREAVARQLRKTYGAKISAKHVYLTCGAAASLTAAIHALAEAGDEFVVISPYFPEYRVFIEGAGGKCVEANADPRFHLNFSALESAIGKNTKAVVINSPNNPTGAVYTAEELAELSRLLQRKSREKGNPVYLISDEPYRELTYGAPAPFPAGAYENTLVCYSFSKSLSLAGERIGYIAVNDGCADADALFAAVSGAARSLGFVCAPALFQRVAEKCVGQTADFGAYRSNRKLLTESLAGMGYAVSPPEGAFYLFVKSPEADAKAFSERAKKHGLLLVPSDSFGITGYVRISYCVPEERIRRALPVFRALIAEYVG